MPSRPLETYNKGQEPRRFIYRPDESVVGGGNGAEVHLPLDGVATRPASGFPVVIIIHGGAFITGCLRQLAASQADYLLERGFALVDIEYRMAPHAGLAEQTEDVLAAFNWVRTKLNVLLGAKVGEPIVNVDAIGVTGDSAGGYHSLMLGINAGPALKAVVPFYGISDLTTFESGKKESTYLGYSEEEITYIKRVFSDGCVASFSPDWEIPSPRTEWRKAVFSSESLLSWLVPNDSFEARRKLSPLHLATVSYPPTYLAIPQFDTSVRPVQSWRFAERLKELGVEVRTARANGGGHCFDRKGGDLNAEGGQWWDEVTRPALDFLISRL